MRKSYHVLLCGIKSDLLVTSLIRSKWVCVCIYAYVSLCLYSSCISPDSRSLILRFFLSLFLHTQFMQYCRMSKQIILINLTKGNTHIVYWRCLFQKNRQWQTRTRAHAHANKLAREQESRGEADNLLYCSQFNLKCEKNASFLKITSFTIHASGWCDTITHMRDNNSTFMLFCCLIWMNFFIRNCFFLFRVLCLDRRESWLLIFRGQWRHTVASHSEIACTKWICVYSIYSSRCFAFWDENSAKYDKWSFELYCE